LERDPYEEELRIWQKAWRWLKGPYVEKSFKRGALECYADADIFFDALFP
jgi:hypothetical protein